MTVKQSVVEHSEGLGNCLSGITVVSCVTQILDQYTTILNLCLTVLTLLASVSFYYLNYRLRKRNSDRQEKELEEVRRRNDLEDKRLKGSVRRRNDLRR